MTKAQLIQKLESYPNEMEILFKAPFSPQRDGTSRFYDVDFVSTACVKYGLEMDYESEEDRVIYLY